MLVKRIGEHNLQIPSQATDGAAGYDLRAVEHVMVYPFEKKTICTGFAFQIPVGMVGIIKGRSGLASSHSIDVLGGVIDSDYRGEVKVMLLNHGERVLVIEAGDRIAQMVVTPCLHSACTEVDELPETARSDNGFGSTGK